MAKSQRTGSTAGTSFKTPAALRAWLAANHDTASELVIRLFKVHAADRGVTYAQALDEALCYGWIDGVRRGGDADSFSIRFTPRRPRSIWSRVNMGHVARLMRENRMMKPGLEAFNARDEKRTAVYAFENRPKALAPRFEKRFRASKSAWAFFNQQPPSYRRTVSYWVMSAKREETQERRLEALMECCARGTRIPQLARPETKPASEARRAAKR